MVGQIMYSSLLAEEACRLLQLSKGCSSSTSQECLCIYIHFCVWVLHYWLFYRLSRELVKWSK